MLDNFGSAMSDASTAALALRPCGRPPPCDGGGRYWSIALRSSLVLGAAEDAGRLVAVARAGRAELAADADHAAARSRAGEERPVDGHRVVAGGGGDTAGAEVGAARAVHGAHVIPGVELCVP